ncbi:MAG: hypothetical protein IKU52_06720, partial [Clostridia bacterium]|nr:hypothetical protein [Clostridia bacterium]
MYSVNEILEYVKMPKECSVLALECLERVKNEEKFIEYKNRFYNGGFAEESLDRYAQSIGERPYMLRLAFCLFCTDTMYEIFKAKGVEDKVYLD